MEYSNDLTQKERFSAGEEHKKLCFNRKAIISEKGCREQPQKNTSRISIIPTVGTYSGQPYELAGWQLDRIQANGSSLRNVMWMNNQTEGSLSVTILGRM